MTSQQTIVVGVDGSEPSRAAARFAVAEAARRGARLVVVQAFEMSETWPDGSAVIGAPSPSEVTAGIEARDRWMLREIARDLGGAALDVPIEALAILGSPVKALLDRSRDADLLVVGHRGRGGLSSAFLGSVGLRCALHATCPVTVVPATTVEHAAEGPVVSSAAAPS